jgi:hypothetical protein
MDILGSEKVAKNGILNQPKYYCENCDYNCFKKYNWTKHLTTDKHKNASMEIKSGKIWHKNGTQIECEICNRLFSTSSGLWKHKKTCKLEEKTESQFDITDKDQLIIMLIKQNAELIKEQGNIRQMIVEQQNVVLEIAKNGTTNTNNSHNNTNSHNKAFNLQFFLNETCKDAMNISEFVESIQFQLSDLERLGEIGYVEGISNIIVKNLNKLDITKRPVHCTDKKRETMYIKDENKWEKDEEQKKLRKMIKKVADKNARLLSKFTEKYPDYKNYYSTDSDKYSKIIVESMGGSGNNDLEKEDKIIRNIAKNVTVEKD